MSKTKDIFIISAHRSGSSWLGKLLGESTKILVRDEEIFSASSSNFCRNPLYPYHSYLRHGPEINRAPYLYIYKQNEHKYKPHIEKLYNNDFYLLEALPFINGLNTARMVFKKKIKTIYRKLKQFERQILIEVAGVFSAEWFASNYNLSVIMIVRHPASFVYSLKLIHSRYDFNKFFEQKLLMENLLHAFKEEISNPPAHNDIVGQGILLWRLVNSVIRKYEKKYNNWTLLRLEDLNSDPVGEIKKLYDLLGLAYSVDAEKMIISYSSNNNPSSDIEAGFENDKRNSEEMISIWKKLPWEDIVRIREGTKDVWPYWYDESDWKIG